MEVPLSTLPKTGARAEYIARVGHWRVVAAEPIGPVDTERTVVDMDESLINPSRFHDYSFTERRVPNLPDCRVRLVRCGDRVPNAVLTYETAFIDEREQCSFCHSPLFRKSAGAFERLC